jgi:hypothetical protein
MFLQALLPFAYWLSVAEVVVELEKLLFGGHKAAAVVLL